MTTTNTTNFKKDVIDHNGTVLLDIWSETCAPCKRMEPIIDKIDDGSIKVVKLNVNGNMKLAQELSINGLPTFIVYKNGKETKRKTGLCSENDILKMF